MSEVLTDETSSDSPKSKGRRYFRTKDMYLYDFFLSNNATVFLKMRYKYESRGMFFIIPKGRRKSRERKIKCK